MVTITELLAEDLGNGRNFYTHHRNWARSVVGEDYADDAYSRFLLRMQEKQEKYKYPITSLNDEKLLRWTRAIFYNILRDMSRELVRQRKRISSSPVEDFNPPSPEEEFDSEFTHESARRVLSNLSINQQRVMQAVYLNGLSYNQASDKLKIPIGTIKSRINAAKTTALKRNKDLIELLQTR